MSDPSEQDMFVRRVQQGLSAFELVYCPHSSWPRPTTVHHHAPRLSVAILDSSFNPPTRAHLALASALCPTAAPYDARLLLLSVRNADKQLKPGDATYAQRLHMMRLLAADLSDADPDANVAVGVVDAPTFVAKATVLQEAIRARLHDDSSTNAWPKPRLTFLQGMDTLERFLAARYYGSEDAMRDALTHFFSPDGDNASIVCARRTMGEATKSEDAIADDGVERALLNAAEEYVSAGRVSVIEIGGTLRRLSSSEVRAKVRVGDEGWKRAVTERVAVYIEEQGLYRE